MQFLVTIYWGPEIQKKNTQSFEIEHPKGKRKVKPRVLLKSKLQ
jgi:hypothetical protein